MDTATQVQTLKEADCISHSINTLRKDMNPIILLPAMADCISHSTNTLWKDMNPIILLPAMGK